MASGSGNKIASFFKDPLSLERSVERVDANVEGIYNKLDDIISIIKEGMGDKKGKKKGKDNDKEDNDKGGKGASGMAKNLGLIGSSIGAIVSALDGFKKVKKELTDFGDVINKLFDDKNIKKWSSKEFTKSVNNVALIGDAVAGIAKALAMATPLLIIGIPGVLMLIPTLALLNAAFALLSVTAVFAFFGMYALRAMGKTMIRFAGALVIAAIVLAINPMALLVPVLFIGIILAFAGLAKIVQITGDVGFIKLVSAVSMIGFSMLAMTGAIMLASFITLEMLAKYAGVLLVMYLTMRLFGSPSMTVMSAEAAANIIMITLSLSLFVMAASSLKDIDAGAVIAGIVLIGAVAGLIFLLSKMKVSLMEGGSVLLFIAGSVFILAFAVRILAKLGPEQLVGALCSVIALTLLVAGVAVALSYAAPLVGAGGGLMVLLSVSVLVLAYAIKKVVDFDIEENSLNGFNSVLLSLAKTFAIIGIPPYAILIGLGAGVGKKVGLATKAIGEGLNTLKGITFDVERFENLGLVIRTLASSLSYLGWPLYKDLVLSGAGAGLAVGSAIKSIAEGLVEVAKLDDENLKKLFGETGTDVKDTRIYQIINSIQEPFAEIGSIASVNFGVFKINNKVKDGIESVQGVGRALCDIAKGVQAFANLQFKDKDGNVIEIKEKELEQVGKNIKTVITSLSATLAEIGETNGETPWFGKSNLDKGKEIVADLGNNLVNIADTVQKFANLEYEETQTETKKGKTTQKKVKLKLTDFDIVKENIHKSINALVEALATIGKKPDVVSSWWQGKTNFEKGALIVKSASDSVKDIASLISTINKAMEESNKDGSIEKLKANIKDIINVITDAVTSKKGETIDNEKVKAVKDFSKSVVEIAENEPQLKLAAEDIKLISNSINSTFDKLKEAEKDKIDAVKQFFEKVIEYEKTESDIIESKTNFVDRALEKIQGVADKVMNVGKGDTGNDKETDKNEEGDNKAPEFDKNDMGSVLAALAESMGKVQEAVGTIKETLSGTVSVYVEGESILKYFK